jgi:hypothetical protein
MLFEAESFRRDPRPAIRIRAQQGLVASLVTATGSGTVYENLPSDSRTARRAWRWARICVEEGTPASAARRPSPNPSRAGGGRFCGRQPWPEQPKFEVAGALAWTARRLSDARADAAEQASDRRPATARSGCSSSFPAPLWRLSRRAHNPPPRRPSVGAVWERHPQGPLRNSGAQRGRCYPRFQASTQAQRPWHRTYAPRDQAPAG